jgi:hypothetical protein
MANAYASQKVGPGHRLRSFASVTMIVHEITGSPVSGFFHRSHRPAKLSTPPSVAVM